MPLLTSSILIIAFTLLTLSFNKITRWQICLICAGVSLTWLTITALMLSGLLLTTHYLLPVAMLMGGTVVGIAFQGEKRFEWAKNLFYWKAPVIIIGFVVAYLLLINLSWTTFITELVLLGFLTYFIFLQPSGGKLPQGETASGLEEKLKDCC